MIEGASGQPPAPFFSAAPNAPPIPSVSRRLQFGNRSRMKVQALARSTRRPSQAYKVLVFDFLVVAALEVGEPGIDALPQAFELQRIHGAALSQRADGVAHRLAGIAIFTGVQHLVDERVLFGRQADIAGRHRPNLIVSTEKVATLATVANPRLPSQPKRVAEISAACPALSCLARRFPLTERERDG